MAEALTLATTSVAGTPRGPEAPLAINPGHVRHWALQISTCTYFSQIATATGTATLALHYDFSLACSLTASACYSTASPLQPSTDYAVYILSSRDRAARNRVLTLARIAWRRLLQSARASGAMTSPMHLDLPRARHNAEAAGRASAPHSPDTEHTIHVSLAWDILVTRTNLLRQTHRGLPTGGRGLTDYP